MARGVPGRAAALGLLLFLAGGAWGGERILFREEFNDLAQWKPFFFEKIENHSRYSIVSQGDERFLKAESDGSASAILYKRTFNVYESPRARWRWKAENLYEKGDVRTREGDDYPLRVYFVFQFDPETASLWERIQYESAKAIHGEYPPHSTLNYIWSSHPHPERIVTNAYTDRAKMVLLRQGRESLGEWVLEEVNVLEDYERAFGKRPPAMAGIAIMNDSDNTKESSVSYLDYIEVFSTDR